MSSLPGSVSNEGDVIPLYLQKVCKVQLQKSLVQKMNITGVGDFQWTEDGEEIIRKCKFKDIDGTAYDAQLIVCSAYRPYTLNKPISMDGKEEKFHFLELDYFDDSFGLQLWPLPPTENTTWNVYTASCEVPKYISDRDSEIKDLEHLDSHQSLTINVTSEHDNSTHTFTAAKSEVQRYIIQFWKEGVTAPTQKETFEYGDVYYDSRTKMAWTIPQSTTGPELGTSEMV